MALGGGYWYFKMLPEQYDHESRPWWFQVALPMLLRARRERGSARPHSVKAATLPCQPPPSPSARPLSRAVHAHVSTREWAASRRGVCARLGTAVPLSSLAPRPSCVCRGPGRFARPLLV